jgi:deoxyribonucleoside regulator
MAKVYGKHDREEMLADIAEMYYMEGKTQAEISQTIGMTRSAISRLLTEARQKGVVEINICRPLRFEADLESELEKRFGLGSAHVVICQVDSRYDDIRSRLGRAGARILSDHLSSNMTLGIAWGTTINEVVESFQPVKLDNVTVVQLVGVLGSNRHEYSGQTLVERMASKGPYGF